MYNVYNILQQCMSTCHNYQWQVQNLAFGVETPSPRKVWNNFSELSFSLFTFNVYFSGKFKHSPQFTRPLPSPRSTTTFNRDLKCDSLHHVKLHSNTDGKLSCDVFT